MSSLAHLRDLELRYDGPVPPQQFADGATLRRRQRGHAALLESQALAFLDAALRCETEIEDLGDDPEVPAEQQVDQAGKLHAAHIRLEAHIACAVAALNRAAETRQALALAPHPLVKLSLLVRAAAPLSVHAHQLSDNYDEKS